MSLKDKLNRYKVHLKKEEPKSSSVVFTDILFPEKWESLHCKPFLFEDDYVMVRETRYPITQKHGHYCFGQLYDVVKAWERSGLSHPLSAAGISVEDLLFFDTETTGLNGGAGNTIFLLGYSRFEDDSVVVRQHFLIAPHAEVALYQSFLADVKDLEHLVTFNGKAFDWPQVKTRHTLLRDLVPNLPAFGHYDLLHGSRRLWKNELESCRLSIIEKHKIGVSRTDDVPGYMAPMLYFDYLHTGDPETIQGILHHNEIDVLSLITLYIHISKLLLEPTQASDVSPSETFEIARWFESFGEEASAIECYQSVADSAHPISGKANIALGYLYKKKKDWDRALRIWESCLNQLTVIPEDVYIEAAKIYEHQFNDYEKALHYTLQAFDIWKKKANLLRRKSKQEQEAYWKRIERLEQRLNNRSQKPSNQKLFS